MTKREVGHDDMMGDLVLTQQEVNPVIAEEQVEVEKKWTQRQNFAKPASGKVLGFLSIFGDAGPWHGSWQSS